MGPYGSVGAHIKTGRSPMAQDHFKTPPDPKMAHKNVKVTNKNLKMTQKSWLGSCWDNCYGLSWQIALNSGGSELFIHLGGVLVVLLLVQPSVQSFDHHQASANV